MAESSETELRFRGAYPIDEPGEVALEDYVRVLLKAAAAHAVRDTAGTHVVAVRFTGATLAPTPQALEDAEDFARSLVTRAPGSGLGWS